MSSAGRELKREALVVCGLGSRVKVRRAWLKMGDSHRAASGSRLSIVRAPWRIEVFLSTSINTSITTITSITSITCTTTSITCITTSSITCITTTTTTVAAELCSATSRIGFYVICSPTTMAKIVKQKQKLVEHSRT